MLRDFFEKFLNVYKDLTHFINTFALPFKILVITFIQIEGVRKVKYTSRTFYNNQLAQLLKIA